MPGDDALVIFHYVLIICNDNVLYFCNYECAQDANSPVSLGTDLCLSLLFECVQRDVLSVYENANVGKHVAAMTAGILRLITQEHSMQGIICQYVLMGVFKTDPGIATV